MPPFLLFLESSISWMNRIAPPAMISTMPIHRNMMALLNRVVEKPALVFRFSKPFLNSSIIGVSAFSASTSASLQPSASVTDFIRISAWMASSCASSFLMASASSSVTPCVSMT